MNIEMILEKILEKKDLFYVFIELPEFWEVRAEGLYGAVYNKNEKQAMIYFKDPIDLRLVERVEWLNASKEVYKIDYYGNYGYAYCKAYLDEGKIVSKSYFSKAYEEKIQVNLSNGVVTVYDRGQVSRIYHSEEEFVEYYKSICE